MDELKVTAKWHPNIERGQNEVRISVWVGKNCRGVDVPQDSWPAAAPAAFGWLKDTTGVDVTVEQVEALLNG